MRSLSLFLLFGSLVYTPEVLADALAERPILENETDGSWGRNLFYVLIPIIVIGALMLFQRFRKTENRS